MPAIAVANRIAVAQSAYLHATERYLAEPTQDHMRDVDAAAITLFLAQTCPVTA